MDLSICIVNWNTKILLRNCLNSIYEKTDGIDFEIIVVDNASTDGSKKMIHHEFPECKFIANQTNLGFSKANNLAVDNAKGEYILFLNPDTELKSNILFKMIQQMNANDAIGAMGCRLVNPDGSIQFSCARTFPGPFKQFCYLSFLYKIFPKIKFFSTIDMNYWDHQDSREVDCLSGACLMVSKNLSAELKRFNEDYFMYAEDVDLCYRIKQKGWSIFYLAEESVIHYSGKSSTKRKNVHFKNILPKESEYQFLAKYWGFPTAVFYKLATALGASIRVVVILMMLLIDILRSESKPKMDHYTLKKYLLLCYWALGVLNIKKMMN